MKRRSPLIFRLMLTSLFLPIFLAVGIGCAIWLIIIKKAHPWFFHDHPEQLFGIPVYVICSILFILPFLLGIWLFRSGNWRRPVLTAGIIYFGLFLFMLRYGNETCAPPEKRMIYPVYGDGYDVYCNGIHLGTTPLHLNVKELREKVAPWDTPPEQRWYAEGSEPAYTWFPWDDFIESRYRESQKLYSSSQGAALTVGSTQKARAAKYARHDAQCRFWWRFEKNGSQLLAQRRGVYYLNRPFEKLDRYDVGINAYSPSVGFHGQLLADALRELSPESKADWDRHVLKHWDLAGCFLTLSLERAQRKVKDRSDDDPEKIKWKTALDSTARMKYDLSDPPTEEECRRVLRQWVDKSRKAKRPFYISNPYESGTTNPENPSWAALPGTDKGLVDAAIRLAGPILDRPLTEQWQSAPWRLEDGWAPVAYIAGINGNPEYFNNFARYSATTHNTRLELLRNNNDRVVPLFRTLLYRRGTMNMLTQKEYLFSSPIRLYGQVDNPKTEPLFRQFVVEALSYPKLSEKTREELNWYVVNAVFTRTRFKDVDCGELADWAATLPLKPTIRDALVRSILFRGRSPKTFAEQIQATTDYHILIDTDLTIEDMADWLKEHPAASLLDYLEAREDRIQVEYLRENKNTFSVQYAAGWDNSVSTSFSGVVSDVPSSEYVVRALLKTDSPESRSVVGRIWRTDEAFVARLIALHYGFRVVDLSDANYLQTIDLPEYLLDLFDRSVSTWVIENSLAPGLSLCESAKAGKLLEKWAGSDGKEIGPQTHKALEVWRIRDSIRRRHMELFEDLITEKIRPDDLLIPTPPWIWKDGRYVVKDME